MPKHCVKAGAPTDELSHRRRTIHAFGSAICLSGRDHDSSTLCPANQVSSTGLTNRQGNLFVMTDLPRQQLQPSPAWLRWFVNDAMRGIVDRYTTAPIGCHYFHDKDLDVWEISLFVSRTEICGGSADGKQVPSGLQIDIAAVCSAFDSAPSAHWQAEKICHDDELGSHLSFEGVARGFSVWLRILQDPPHWTGPGRLVHASCGTIEDVW